MIPRLDEILKAAADPTRLRILNLLRLGSICVCDLQDVLDLPQSTVSRHLAALRHAELVIDTRIGPRVIYSLAPPVNQQFAAFQDFLEAALRHDETLLPDIMRLSTHVKQRMKGRKEEPEHVGVGASGTAGA